MITKEHCGVHFVRVSLEDHGRNIITVGAIVPDDGFIVRRRGHDPLTSFVGGDASHIPVDVGVGVGISVAVGVDVGVAEESERYNVSKCINVK